jgi:hypothetical protein
MTRYSLSIELDLGDHATKEEARERARSLVFRLPWKDISKIDMRAGRRLVQLADDPGAQPILSEMRPCAEEGCDGHAIRSSNTGRWPERCPEHQRKHRSAGSAKRTAQLRQRRREG